MGRLAAYLGPRTQIAQLIEGGSYALSQQASDFPDGFGLGWYPEDGLPTPLRMASLRSAARADDQLDIPRRYFTECGMATLKGPGPLPVEHSQQQPFQKDRYLFAHDGELEQFSEVFRRPLQERLSNHQYQGLLGHEASELLFATWLDALGEEEGQDAMANALEQMVSTVNDIAHNCGAGAAFGVVVTDGSCLVTLRTATHGPPPALYTIVAGDNAPVPATGRVIASEPLFPGSWSSIEPHSLMIFTVQEDEPANLDAPSA